MLIIGGSACLHAGRGLPPYHGFVGQCSCTSPPMLYITNNDVHHHPRCTITNNYVHHHPCCTSPHTLYITTHAVHPHTRCTSPPTLYTYIHAIATALMRSLMQPSRNCSPAATWVPAPQSNRFVPRWHAGLLLRCTGRAPHSSCTPLGCMQQNTAAPRDFQSLCTALVHTHMRRRPAASGSCAHSYHNMPCMNCASLHAQADREYMQLCVQ
jgi:hypothetical protein